LGKSNTKLLMELQNKEDNHEWVPAYIGLGAQKSASSWLSKCIREHPEFSTNQKKELHFFDADTNYNKGIKYYRSLLSNEPGLLTGEITPAYLYERKAPARIHKHFPDAKLIVCLRDPSDRAWSHYNYGLQMHGRLSVYSSFREAFESDRSLADNGRYGEQLESYLAYFSKDQIKIIFYEDLRTKPVQTIQDVYKFIGVKDPNYIPTTITTRVNNTQKKAVTLKHEKIWLFMLKIRGLLHRYPKIESLLKSHGLISWLKHKVRKEIHSDVSSTTTKTIHMSTSDRQLVLKELKTDIEKLENITGRSLDHWKV